MSVPEGISIARDVSVKLYPFTDYFRGFERIEAVRKLFGERTEEVLRNLRVEFGGRKGYMGVSEDDGHIAISTYYLNHGDAVDIYLDLIHELVHVKQLMEGKELLDRHYIYVNRPTEIEAFRYAVEEARRIGLSEERICEYLKTEHMSDEDFQMLAEAVNVHCRISK